MAINTRKQEINLNSLEEVKNRLSTNSVRSLFVDNSQQVFLGIGSYGLILSEKGRYIYYKDHPDFRNISNMPTINKIIQSKKNGKIWIATDGEGIFVYDKKLHRDRVQNINTNNNSWLCNNCVFPLLEDSHGNIWIGTLTGLSIYDSNKRKGYSYTNLGQKTYDISKFAVTAIQQDDDTTVWLGTDYGIFKAKFNPKSPDKLILKYYSVAQQKLKSDKIKTINRSITGFIYIGTDGGGLSNYDRSTDCFVNLHAKFNLPGDLVNIITEDNSGNIWMATNSGLVRLSVKMDNLELINSRLYTTVDGLQDNFFNKYAMTKATDGKLYFGGHKGYNDFYSDKLIDNTDPAPVVVTDIKIQNQSLNQINPRKRKKISELSAEFTQKVVLSYRDNNFNIEFSALSFSNPEQNKYAYKLDGFDKEWQYTDADRRFAYYNNLEPGKYYFRLKAANENGVWTERANVIEFVVLPAPWLSWWAYLLYLIFIGLIIMFIFRTMKNRVELRNALKINQLEKDKIEELNHAKLQFFTNISHEFLTPLTIISATLDELKISFPQNNEFYNIMSGNINRLIRLLQQILEFRKAETGNLKLKVSKSDIAVFVRNTVESFRPLMNKKKIHFSVMCDPEFIPGYFDADKLDKIIYNLLSNAAKYNKEGGFVQVNISISDDKKQVIITVKDNGDGINEKAMKNLFVRFYEGEYRKFNTTGTGIGLSLTKDLVELHKGTIRAESVEGQGTTFILNIPIVREAFAEDQIGDYTYISDVSLPVNGEEETIVSEENDSNKEHTLLIVEDNEELLQVLVKLLNGEYNILTAVNGLQAIKQVEKNDVTLIVSDVMMAEMDGVEMCRYLKNQEDYSHIPVLLLTAKDAEDDKIAAYEAGADGYINKPFNLSLLKAKIGSLIKAKIKQAQNFKNQLVPELHNMNYTSMDEKFLQKAIDCVYRFIDDADFDQQRFTEEMATSKSTLYKKLKSLTGLNTSQFINNVRLKAACALIIEKKKIRVSELAYAVGYNDPKYFSTCFKKEFGMIPSEYLEKILEHDNVKSEKED
jgi:signal transduction histidine kinase/CheY-like chemotaxis protein/AraC-like DNA-binding protein/sugar lactone lactonase YvrE